VTFISHWCVSTWFQMRHFWLPAEHDIFRECAEFCVVRARQKMAEAAPLQIPSFKLWKIELTQSMCCCNGGQTNAKMQEFPLRFALELHTCGRGLRSGATEQCASSITQTPSNVVNLHCSCPTNCKKLPSAALCLCSAEWHSNCPIILSHHAPASHDH